MRKIVMGVLGLVMTIAVTTGAAFALFSDTATITGVTVNAGNAHLQVADFFTYNGGLGFTDTINYPSVFTPNVFPGYHAGSLTPVDAYDLYLKNNSTSAISLAPSMQLTTLPAGWGNNLTYAFQILVQDSVSMTDTGWKSLPQWQSGSVALPGTAIPQNADRKYYVYIRVPFNYGDNEAGTYVGGPAQGTVVGNEIQNESLSNGGFTITGTQTP